MFRVLLALSVAAACAEAPVRPSVVVDGNSLSASINGVPAMPWFLEHLSKAPIRVTNLAVPGASTAQLLKRNVDAQLQPDAQNILVLWEGTNDLYYGLTAEQAYANLRRYAEARKQAGWTVVIVTLLPRGDDKTPAYFEVDRQAVNAQLRKDWRSYADLLVDVGADPIMGDPTRVHDPYWYQTDRTHLTHASSYRIGQLIAEALQGLLRSPSSGLLEPADTLDLRFTLRQHLSVPVI
jgi:lysophospholipase L1-like esterase